MADDDPAVNLKQYSQSKQTIHKQLESIKSRIDQLQFEVESKSTFSQLDLDFLNSQSTSNSQSERESQSQLQLQSELSELIEKCCLLESELNKINEEIKSAREVEKDDLLRSL